MLKFPTPTSSPFECEFVSMNDLVRDPKYKKFREDNKEYVRQYLEETVTKRIAELQNATKKLKISPENKDGTNKQL